MSLPQRANSRRRNVGGEVQLDKEVKVVIIGGGIAGVSCAQELARLSGEDNSFKIVLVSESDILKETRSGLKVTEHLEEMHVYERTSSTFALENPRVVVKIDRVEDLDTENRTLRLYSGASLPYTYICVCTGARPKLVAQHPLVLGIRDLESVQELSRRLQDARRVALVGNGGIALELAHSLRSCTVDWLIKDGYIGNTFFDASSSRFVMDAIANKGDANSHCAETITNFKHGPRPFAQVLDNNDVSGGICDYGSKRNATTADMGGMDRAARGWALGPDWQKKSNLEEGLIGTSGMDGNGTFDMSNLRVHYQTDVLSIIDTPSSAFPIAVKTTSGSDVECDIVISATGVEVIVPFLGTELERDDEDNGIVVDIGLRTSAPHVFAAGDCCSLRSLDKSKHWFQMRLWSQAKNMGAAAAHSIWFEHQQKVTVLDTSSVAREELQADYEMYYGNSFQIFTHITHFFGYKVVLLGRFNGQGLGEIIESTTKTMLVGASLHENKDDGEEAEKQGAAELTSSKKRRKVVTVDEDLKDENNVGLIQPLEIWTRVSPGVDYIKVTVLHGRVVGAMLVGETDLEETFENLILNELDVSRFGIQLLDPNIDLEDYFD